MFDDKLVNDYWEKFKNSSGVTDDEFGEAYQFGYGKKMADELAELVNQGIKTATTSAIDLYEPDDPVPSVGNYDIILNGDGKPVCITKTEVTEIVAYDQVSAEHAYHEGEGDRSLKYWRSVHETLFRMEYDEDGKKFNEHIPCLCEVFKVVYR